MLAFFQGMDTLVWQMLASVVLPGYLIHVIVALTALLMHMLEARQAVLGLLVEAANKLGVGSDVFLLTLNRSVPTFVGLVGECSLVFRVACV
jgi:hypothetical protein